MVIIRQVEIKNFRSCKNVTIPNLANLNAICGKNNVGKSNALRAICLFFAGYIEPGVPFDMRRDCSAKPRKKKETEISIQFSIPNELKIQKTLETALNFVKDGMVISKKFSVDLSSPDRLRVDYSIDNKLIPPQDKIRIDQFLNLFNFRYITADRSAKSVLEENLTELQAELEYRMNKSDSAKSNPQAVTQSTVIDEIKALADKLFSPIASELTKADPSIHGVRLSTPESITELLHAARYQLTLQDGGTYSEVQQGIGIQSLLLFSVLILIDKNFHRKFGWKIATIWAIEEPETFLHHDLEIQLANYLASIAKTAKDKFQIFWTTHNPTFAGISEATYLFTLNPAISNSVDSVCESVTYLDLVKKLQAFGIIPAMHVLALYPMQTLVLVEGHIDEYILGRLLKEAGYDNFKIFAIENLVNDTSVRGGSQLARLLEGSLHLIRHRKPKHGVLGVFDWDTAESDLKFLRKNIPSNNHIYKFDTKHANPDLDEKFRGVERYYPTSVVERVKNQHTNPNIIFDRGSKVSGGRYSCDTGDKYKKVKHELYQAMKQDSTIDPAFFQDFLSFYKQNFT